MRLLLTWSIVVVTLTGNGLGGADRSPAHRWPCLADCVCLSGGGDDVTRSRGGELCVRSAEVGQLSTSRLASVTSLSISGRPSAVAAAARQLTSVRRLLIVSVNGSDLADWVKLFSAFSRLHELTIRNSSSAAAAAALSADRFLPQLRRLDLSGSGASVVEMRSLKKLRNLDVLDLSGNLLTQITAVNDTACIDYDESPVCWSFLLPDIRHHIYLSEDGGLKDIVDYCGR